MYYLKGQIVEIYRDYIILETQNTGYKINFLNASDLKRGEEHLIYIFQEAKLEPKGQLITQLFGFLNRQDYEIFRFLLSIKGIGSKTAQKILTNNWNRILSLAESEDVVQLSTLKGFNTKLANLFIATLRNSKTIKQSLLSFPISNLSSREIWDEYQIINSLSEIGYKWKDIRKTLEIVKPRKTEFVDLNSIISECVKTIAKNSCA